MFVFLKYTPRNGIAGSYRKSRFNFLRKWQTIFQSDYTIFYFHQQCIKVSIFYILANTFIIHVLDDNDPSG